MANEEKPKLVLASGEEGDPVGIMYLANNMAAPINVMLLGEPHWDPDKDVARLSALVTDFAEGGPGNDPNKRALLWFWEPAFGTPYCIPRSCAQAVTWFGTGMARGKRAARSSVFDLVRVGNPNLDDILRGTAGSR